MSSAQTPPSDRGATPLMSNNPFRNKILSSSKPQNRPTSTNPFLDMNEFVSKPATSQPVNERISPPGPMVEEATDTFAMMRINSLPGSPNRPPRPIPNDVTRRPENTPPSRRMLPPGHKPSLSEEERNRQHRSRGPQVELDIFADPTDAIKARERHQRRNSESSIRDKPSRSLDPEDEKRRRERKHRDAKRSGKPKTAPRKLDVIDKLDVTSIYGTGLFHHDGPFDACNPHRNRKGSRQAPMQAFPAGSTNMSIGGSGPVKTNFDYDKFHGVGQEAHRDYNEAALVDEDADYLRRPQVDRTNNFNPHYRDAIHGDETVGLGTSTFLEGAPASRAAIERRESENEAAQVYDGGAGLTRKKSIVQKFRGVRQGREAPRVMSPNGVATPASPMATGKSDSVVNPFFKDYEKKPTEITFVEDQPKIGRARAPSSPRRGGAVLERMLTGESVPEEPSKPTGFLGRMKSLKGPRRPRGDRRETSG